MMDRLDDAYNGMMGEGFMRKTRERLHWICAKVDGTDVLDVGCSQGTLARLLAPYGKSVTAIDLNPDAIAYAEDKVAELAPSARERIHYQCVNFMDFESEDRYDTVVIGEVLEHLATPEHFLQKAHGSLKKGGRIVITVPFGINDDPDHRQTFYLTWIEEIVAPLFEVKEVNYFGKWLGVVGVKREKKSAAAKSMSLSSIKELEKAFYGIERPLVDDGKAKKQRLADQEKAVATAKESLAQANLAVKTAKAAQSKAETAGAEQKSRADKAMADYTKLKGDLTAEIATQKDAAAKAVAAKSAAEAAAAKLKTALEGEIAKQKNALTAEQTKTKDLNSKLAAARSELAATKNEALELRISLDAEKKISAGETEQIAVLKAALQFAANRPQIEANDTRLLEYSQEVRELRSALDSKRDEAAERAERLGRLSGLVESLKAETALKTEMIDRIAAERAEFERDVALLRQDCKEKDARLAKENAKVLELTAALAQANKDAEDKAAALSNSIGELESYAKLCETEISKLTNDREALVKAKDVQSRDIGVIKEEKGAVEASLAAANAEKVALTSRVSELESSLAVAKKAAEEKVARILELSSDLSKSKARADKAVADYYKLKSDLMSRIARQDDALAKANARADKAAGDYHKLKNDLASRIAKLDDALAEANARADKAAGDYRKLKSDLTARIAEQDAALAKLAAEKAAVEADANLEREGLSSRILELEASLGAAKEALEEKDAKVIDLSSNLEEANARADKVAEDYSKLNNDLTSRIAQQDDALAKLAAEKAAVEADTAKRNAELSNHVDSLQKERAGLLEALRHSEKIARRESSKYDKLAKAKLGRLTLAYWKLKDGLKKKLTNTTDKNTHNRPGSLQGNSKKSVLDNSDAANSSPIWKSALYGGSFTGNFRVLFPCGSGNNPGANPFVGTLMETMISLGARVSYGADRLFKEDERFDVVHFMWPDALFGWTHKAISSEMITKLEEAIKRHKESGAIIAYTRHNVRPHVDDNPLLIQAYDIVEKSADLVFHMGEYSLKEFKDKYPESSSENVVVPHHTYARIPRSVTRKEAREWFGLSEDDKVVLSFGVFRNDDERNLLRSAVKGCNIENLKVLAPRFSSCPPAWIMGHSTGAVPEQILPMYFAAADVVFIQRCQILNSGNVIIG